MVRKNAAKTNPSSQPALAFCLRLTRTHALLTRRLDNALSNLHGLSFADYMVLYQLHHAPGGRLRRVELAERVGLTASGVTRSLIPLEKIGLVAREADVRDARVGYALLTETGQQLFADASVSAAAVAVEATGDLATDELEHFHGVLGMLAAG